MRLLDILGDKREFAKLDKFLGINTGRLFLTAAAQDCLVIRCKDWMMLSKDLEIVCGQHFLSEGGIVSSGVLAAEEDGFSHGRYLPCGRGEWIGMKTSGNRQMIEKDIDEFMLRMSVECENIIPVSERYRRGEYTTTSTASLDIRSNKRNVGSSSSELVIMEDDTGRYFVTINHETLKGLHMLGAEIYSKIMPEYEVPFTYFVIDNPRSFGTIESKTVDQGIRVTRDGRPMSHGVCKVCWISVEKAQEMLHRESSCFVRMVVETGRDPTEYLDEMIVHKRGGSPPLLLAISALRWHGLTDEGIVNILSDAEDEYLREEYRGADYEAQKIIAMYQNTRNSQASAWRAGQVARNVAAVMDRIRNKYPGTVVDYPAHVREAQSLFGIGDYATDVPF